jgi:hypothetical protein
VTVIPFKPNKTTKAKRALAAKAALDRLRRLGKGGPVAVDSYAGLANRFGWDRKKTWQQVARWEEAGKVTTEKAGNELKSIQVLPDTAKGKGAGVAKPPRPQKTASRRAKGVLKTDLGGVLKMPSRGIPESVLKGVLNSDAARDRIPEASQSSKEKIEHKKSNTYDNHHAVTMMPETPACDPENTSVESTQKTEPEASPTTPTGALVSGIPQPHFKGIIMGIFSRKPQPESAVEPPAGSAETREAPAEYGYGGYAVPAAVAYPAPALHAEKPQWKFSPHRSPAKLPGEQLLEPVATPHRRPAGKRSYALTLVAYALFALGVGIVYWGARTTLSGDWLDMAIPIAISVTVEAALFFLPARFVDSRVQPMRRLAALGIFGFFLTFAAMNALKVASLTIADQGAARGDRQTVGTQAADRRLDAARAERDRSCRAGQGRSQACRSAQDDVAKLERAQTTASAVVQAGARPENADFSAMVSWVTRGALQPGARDFDMLMLLLRTLLPLLGGVVLAVARP